MTRKLVCIEIDDEALESVMRRYGLRTRAEPVDPALRRLTGRGMSREEALAMRGRQAVAAVPDDTHPTA
ncbi:MAG: type II toxin-antitoxin system VapB family antitoxin [Acidobacteriota bacterium]